MRVRAPCANLATSRRRSPDARRSCQLLSPGRHRRPARGARVDSRHPPVPRRAGAAGRAAGDALRRHPGSERFEPAAVPLPRAHRRPQGAAGEGAHRHRRPPGVVGQARRTTATTRDRARRQLPEGPHGRDHAALHRRVRAGAGARAPLPRPRTATRRRSRARRSSPRCRTSCSLRAPSGTAVCSPASTHWSSRELRELLDVPEGVFMAGDDHDRQARGRPRPGASPAAR